MPTYPIDVKVNPQGAVTGSTRAKRELRSLREEANKVKSAMLAVFAGAAAGAGLAGTVSLLAEFSQEMSTVRAITGATRQEMTQLQATAERLGRTTRFTATQAGEGMSFLARAGFETNEILGSIEGTLQLAQAGAIDLGSAADIASNALKGFRLDVSETQRVVDVMALTVNSSNTDMRQLGDAMKYVGPIAAGLGVQIEATAAAIGSLSDAGLQGEMAGTGLRRVMIGLERQTNEGERILRSYGLTIEDIAVTQTESLADSLERLRDAGVSTSDAMVLFGLRGGPAFEVLAQSVDDIREMEGELNNAAGTAERMARIMDENLNGSILAARSALEGFIIAMGNAGITDALTASFQALGGGLRFMADNAEIILPIMTAFIARAGIMAVANTNLARSAGASVAGFFAQTSALRVSTVAMIAASTAARGLTVGLLGILAANPVTLTITALGAAFLFLRDEAVSTQETFEELQGTITRYRSVSNQIERDTGLLAEKHEELTAAILETGDASQSAARLEIASIADRIRKNEELRQTYRQLLDAQLQVARATQTQNDDSELARLTGVSRQERVETYGGNNARVSYVDRDQNEFREEANAVLEEQLRLIQEIQAEDANATLTPAQINILEFNAQRLEDLEEIQRLEEAIRNIDNPETGATGSGDGETGSGTGEVTREFAEQFRELQRMTDAIGQSEAAQERANQARQFARDLGRELTDVERGLVEAELTLQQTLQDQNGFERRVRNMEQEIELAGLSRREAEVRSILYEAENDSLLGLTAQQEKRIENLIRERQAVEDDQYIRDRLQNLETESQLLGLVGREAAVATEILRLQNQLERDLTETEIAWISSAVELNQTMRIRNGILRDAIEPNEKARDHMREMINLYREGSITLAQYNRLLQENQTANDLRSIEQDLNSRGANIGPSDFELERMRAEAQVRRQEGGGVDDGSDQMLFGMTSGELGVQSEADALRQQTQDRLDILREARDQELLTEQEFLERKEALFKDSQDRQRDLLLQGLQTQLGAAEEIFGSITDILKNTAGEQSGIYKAMFAVQKAFAIAQAIINIQRGISEAAALPFPANLPAMASVAAATASIVSNIQQVKANFRDGGLPLPANDNSGLLGGVGGPREDANLIRVSRGEFIVNADATRRNLTALQYLNENGSLPFYRDGGQYPASAIAPPSSNDNRATGSTTINVGGVHISIPEGASKKEARELGEEAGRAFVRQVLQEESLPMGFLDQTFKKAG